MLRSLLAAGVQPVGDLDQCHAVAIDARAPKFDGGIASRIDAVPFSVVLNKQAGSMMKVRISGRNDMRSGGVLAGQPDQTAFAPDSAGVDRFMPSVFTPITDDTIEGLARKLGLDPARTRQAIDAFNAACPKGPNEQSILDGRPQLA